MIDEDFYLEDFNITNLEMALLEELPEPYHSMIWKPIPGFDDYYCSEFGDIFSTKRISGGKQASNKPKILSAGKTQKGDEFYKLYKGKEDFTRSKRTLLYLSFCGPISKGGCVRLKDESKPLHCNNIELDIIGSWMNE